MSAKSPVENISQIDVNSRLLFLKNLQVVTNKIHATNNVDEIMNGSGEGSALLLQQ